MSADNVFISSFNKLREGIKAMGEKVPDEQFAPVRVMDPYQEAETQAASWRPGFSAAPGRVNSSGKHENDLLDFDIGSLLRLRSFLYLLAGTGVFLFQTHNTLAIINLAKENEQLREQIQMTSSVITSQELKVHELHSIHNIAQTAEALGLAPSSVPSVKLEP